MPHAAGKSGCQPFPEWPEARELEEFVAGLGVIAKAVNLREKGDVRVHREVAVEAEALRKVAQP